MAVRVCLLGAFMLGTLLPTLALAVGSGAAARAQHKRKLLELPLVIKLARCKGKPVRSRAWLKRHLTAANAIFKPHGFVLKAQIEPFVPERCELETRAHRNALAGHAEAKGITVLVVKRAADIDLAGYNLMGVHWRYGGANKRYRGRRWVILTARAWPPVLAHELCHYFGLRHDRAGGNLMTPGPSDPIWRRKGNKPKPFAPRLSAAQVTHLRRWYRRHLKPLER